MMLLGILDIKGWYHFSLFAAQRNYIQRLFILW